MALFQLMFPREAARLERAERVLSRVVDLAGYDEWADPLLAGVEDEVRAGRDIKAAQLYAKATGSGVGAARLAVTDLKTCMAAR